MAVPSSPSVYRRLGPRNLRLNLDVVLRFAVDAVSVLRAQNRSYWNGTCERCRTVGTEYRRGRDQVRICRYRC